MEIISWLKVWVSNPACVDYTAAMLRRRDHQSTLKCTRNDNQYLFTSFFYLLDIAIYATVPQSHVHDSSSIYGAGQPGLVVSYSRKNKFKPIKLRLNSEPQIQFDQSRCQE